MKLQCRDRTFNINRPLIMGVVNATPDSFSDGGDYNSLQARIDRALEVAELGAHVLDIGGQSAITGVPEISDAEEIDRVLPVLEGVRPHTDAIISIDTYKPAVAEATLRAGADIINDISGVLAPELASIVAHHRAGMIVMHTRWKPKTKFDARHLYDDVEGGVVADVIAFLTARMAMLRAAGITDDQIIVDPGPDFAKTAAQTVEVLRALPELTQLGRPILLALSRKDFIGVITGRPPRERLAGTLAAAAATTALAPSSILRVHDIAEVREFLAVLDVLDGRAEIDGNAQLSDTLRWQSRVAAPINETNPGFQV